MKRVGKRGSGEFERISWDEALDIIAEKWKYTLDTYGSEAFYNCATGTRNYPIQRLMNLTGGYLAPTIRNRTVRLPKLQTIFSGLTP